MGFSQITLADPKCSIDQHSYQLACHSAPLLDKIKTAAHISDCLEPDSYVIGFSNRPRNKGPIFHQLPEGLKAQKNRLLSGQKFSFVFGSENFGLSNEEVSFCDEIWEIPTRNPNYSSLNLAQAVQVLAFQLSEIFRQSDSVVKPEALVESDSEVVNLKGLNQVVESISQCEKMRDFMKKTTCDQTKNRLIQLLKNGVKNQSDLKFMMGFLKVIDKLVD